MKNDTYAELQISAAVNGGYVVFDRPVDRGFMTAILFAGNLADALAYIERSLVKQPATGEIAG